MADKSIVDLPQLSEVTDATLIPVYQPNSDNPAQKMPSSVFRNWAEDAVFPAAKMAQEASVTAVGAEAGAQSALVGVQNAIKSIPAGSTPIVNDLTTGGVTMALSAEQGKALRQAISALTAADVGAAPAGFGLGATAKLLTSEDDLNTIFQSGWYLYGQSKGAPQNVPNPGGIYLGQYGLVQVIAYSSNSCVQIAYNMYSVSRDNISAMRTIDNGVGEWEWVNPPMTAGYEYRTTERIDGKAVYKKNVNGVIQYRLDGETEWKPYAKAVGALHTGSYTGNGSATARTIDTGGSGRWVAIDASVNGVVAIVSAYGGAVYKVNDTIGTLSATQASFRNGVLTIATATAININGTPYAYQVL